MPVLERMPAALVHMHVEAGRKMWLHCAGKDGAMLPQVHLGAGAGTVAGKPYFAARLSMSLHIYFTLLALQGGNGVLFMSSIIWRTLNGINLKLILCFLSISFMRMTVRYVYVLPIENQNSNSMLGFLFKRLIINWFKLSERLFVRLGGQ